MAVTMVGRCARKILEWLVFDTLLTLFLLLLFTEYIYGQLFKLLFGCRKFFISKIPAVLVFRFGGNTSFSDILPPAPISGTC